MSCGFRDNVRVPGTTALSKRVTQGTAGVGTVEQLTADYGLRLVYVRHRGKAIAVPFENITEIVP